MAVILTKIGKTPGQPQFGLDTFTEHYKANATADAVLTDGSVPQRGAVHPDYPFMFLTDRHVQETGERASALDLVYTGCLKGDGEGGPLLPPQQNETDNAVMSASSSRSQGGVVLSSPLTAQYYAPTSQLSYISFGAPGTDEAPDPTTAVQIITVTIGDGTFTGVPGNLIGTFFTIQTLATFKSTEIVAGQFWQNVAKKVRALSPWIFDYPAGAHMILASPSLGYAVGDVVSISVGGDSASIQVDAPISPYGYILNYHQLSNTFTTPQTLVAGSPPTHGPPRFTALWNVIII